jgi:hypothetical protein
LSIYPISPRTQVFLKNLVAVVALVAVVVKSPYFSRGLGFFRGATRGSKSATD